MVSLGFLAIFHSTYRYCTIARAAKKMNIVCYKWNVFKVMLSLSKDRSRLSSSPGFLLQGNNSCNLRKAITQSFDWQYVIFQPMVFPFTQAKGIWKKYSHRSRLSLVCSLAASRLAFATGARDPQKRTCSQARGAYKLAVTNIILFRNFTPFCTVFLVSQLFCKGVLDWKIDTFSYEEISLL